MAHALATRSPLFLLTLAAVGCGSAATERMNDGGVPAPEGGEAASDARAPHRPSTDDASGADAKVGRGDAPSDGRLPEEASATLSVQTMCATAVVVGLEWSPLASVVNYEVSRDGTSLGKTVGSVYADTTVTASTSFTYSVTGLQSDGQRVSSGPVTVMTAAASPNGDPAYCPSSLIKAMTWNWSTGFNQQNGSDLWPATWGADGNVYTFFGDGGGFFGSDSSGRASFGVAKIASSSPVITSSDASNVFGGLSASHPSTLNGKAGSLIAIGNDFYAIGSIYRSGDSGGPSGAPNHSEIVYSQGDAYSWQDNSWVFCNDTVNLSGFCPGSFINYGKGNEGARDSYVYVMGTTAASFFSTTGVPGPASTYLVRVPNTQLLTQSAYEAYAGLDMTDNPVWSSDLTQMQPIFTDRGPRPIGIGEAVYNPVLQRYIATGQGTIGQAAFYESVNPWGPWYSVGYYNTDADGTGGWGNLGLPTGTTGGDSLGINFVNAWTSSDGRTMWAQFSSDGTAPTAALLAPLAGNAFDSYSLVSVTLTL
jgi:hypothetical protein